MKKFYTYNPETFKYVSTVEVNDTIVDWEHNIPKYSVSLRPQEADDADYESTLEPTINQWINLKRMIYATDTLEVARQKKIHELFAEYTAAFDFVNTIYPPAEREGWLIQLEEARAYLANNSAVTPTLSLMIMLRGRGENLEEFAHNVIGHNEQYRLFYALLTGQQQRMYADIVALETVEEILDYKIQFQMSF